MGYSRGLCGDDESDPETGYYAVALCESCEKELREDAAVEAELAAETRLTDDEYQEVLDLSLEMITGGKL